MTVSLPPLLTRTASTWTPSPLERVRAMSVPVQRRRFPARTVRTVMAMYRLGLPVPGIRSAFPTMDVDMILRIKTSKEDDRARSGARSDVDRLAGLHPLAGRAQETTCAGCGQADGQPETRRQQDSENRGTARNPFRPGCRCCRCSAVTTWAVRAPPCARG